ncbi:MAG: redox-regulated ATPase YchF [Gammaproteobacteria bacterium]
MGFKCGIVGLPNVGKSTLFNALTRSNAAAAENYPFCTIDPNVGMVSVPDARLAQLAALVSPQKIIPAAVEFVDIAGLVAGAADGEGLGNRFLAHIREVDAIAHVARAFADGAVTHVADTIDPAADIDIVNTELLLADIETAGKALQRATTHSKAGDKKQLALRDLLGDVKMQLEQGTAVRAMPLDDAQLQSLKPCCFLSAKAVIYVANIGEGGGEGSGGDNPRLRAIEEIAARENAQVVALCAAIEQELAGLSEQEAAPFLADMNMREPGLARVIRAGYALLGLHTFFTAGPKEVRAWTVRIGARAADAAGVIHTDFQKGFIRAETIAFEDYLRHNGEHGAKEAGRLRLEGKEYVVADGDVMHFRFNV